MCQRSRHWVLQIRTIKAEFKEKKQDKKSE